ncbi:unnamed protein product [Notodromas monacha]|uniref:Uncharacterized protein n=1 Tax=Notodromas monacha TaxID=399045 RepID=A0A7R9BPT6_9CRUS|nr:unnamed protein product [Notodromas monacha]CAG0918095.1 unnamed protein product [Notodromas monacha]
MRKLQAVLLVLAWVSAAVMARPHSPAVSSFFSLARAVEAEAVDGLDDAAEQAVGKLVDNNDVTDGKSKMEQAPVVVRSLPDHADAYPASHQAEASNEPAVVVKRENDKSGEDDVVAVANDKPAQAAETSEEIIPEEKKVVHETDDDSDGKPIEQLEKDEENSVESEQTDAKNEGQHDSVEKVADDKQVVTLENDAEKSAEISAGIEEKSSEEKPTLDEPALHVDIHPVGQSDLNPERPELHVNAVDKPVNDDATSDDENHHSEGEKKPEESAEKHPKDQQSEEHSEANSPEQSQESDADQPKQDSQPESISDKSKEENNDSVDAHDSQEQVQENSVSDQSQDAEEKDDSKETHQHNISAESDDAKPHQDDSAEAESKELEHVADDASNENNQKHDEQEEAHSKESEEPKKDYALKSHSEDSKNDSEEPESKEQHGDSEQNASTDRNENTESEDTASTSEKPKADGEKSQEEAASESKSDEAQEPKVDNPAIPSNDDVDDSVSEIDPDDEEEELGEKAAPSVEEEERKDELIQEPPSVQEMSAEQVEVQDEEQEAQARLGELPADDESPVPEHKAQDLLLPEISDEEENDSELEPVEYPVPTLEQQQDFIKHISTYNHFYDAFLRAVRSSVRADKKTLAVQFKYKYEEVMDEGYLKKDENDGSYEEDDWVERFKQGGGVSEENSAGVSGETKEAAEVSDEGEDAKPEEKKEEDSKTEEEEEEKDEEKKEKYEEKKEKDEEKTEEEEDKKEKKEEKSTEKSLEENDEVDSAEDAAAAVDRGTEEEASNEPAAASSERESRANESDDKDDHVDDASDDSNDEELFRTGPVRSGSRIPSGYFKGLDSIRRSGNVRMLRFTEDGVAVEGEFETGEIVFHLRTDGQGESVYQPMAYVDNIKGIVQYVVKFEERKGEDDSRAIIHSGEVLNYFVKRVDPDAVTVNKYVREDFVDDIKERMSRFVELELLHFNDAFVHQLPSILFEEESRGKSSRSIVWDD